MERKKSKNILTQLLFSYCIYIYIYIYIYILDVQMDRELVKMDGWMDGYMDMGMDIDEIDKLEVKWVRRKKKKGKVKRREGRWLT